MGLIRALKAALGAVNNIANAAFLLADKFKNVWDNLPDQIKPVIQILGLFRMPLVALLLILDDLATYVQGGQSVFGLIVDGIKQLGNVMLQPFEQLAKYIADNIINPLRSATDYISSKFGGRRPELGDEPFDPTFSPYSNDNTPLPGETAQVYKNGQWRAADNSEMSLLDQLYRPGESAQPSGDFRNTLTGGPSRTINQNNTFHVQGGDPQATAGAIGNTLERQLSYSTSDFNNSANY